MRIYIYIIFFLIILQSCSSDVAIHCENPLFFHVKDFNVENYIVDTISAANGYAILRIENKPTSWSDRKFRRKCVSNSQGYFMLTDSLNSFFLDDTLFFYSPKYNQVEIEGRKRVLVSKSNGTFSYKYKTLELNSEVLDGIYRDENDSLI